MKVYVIPKGTKVVLANEDGSFTKVVSKKEVSFMDYVEDVVYNHNRKIDTPNYQPKAPVNIRKMFDNYYSMFRIDNTHTSKPYQYVFVNYDDINILF